MGLTARKVLSFWQQPTAQNRLIQHCCDRDSFDRRIPVELPDLQGRVEILKVHAKKIKIAPNVDFQAIARTAAGASGAELANIVNEAALRAVRMGRKSATQEDMMESVEVVIAGYQKKKQSAFQQGKS